MGQIAAAGFSSLVHRNRILDGTVVVGVPLEASAFPELTIAQTSVGAHSILLCPYNFLIQENTIERNRVSCGGVAYTFRQDSLANVIGNGLLRREVSSTTVLPVFLRVLISSVFVFGGALVLSLCIFTKSTVAATPWINGPLVCGVLIFWIVEFSGIGTRRVVKRCISTSMNFRSLKGKKRDVTRVVNESDLVGNRLAILRLVKIGLGDCNILDDVVREIHKS